MDMYKDAMQKLHEAIRSRGSIRSLAEELDLNPSTVSRWFAEDRSPDFRTLTILFEYFGVRIVFPNDLSSTENSKDQTIKVLQEELVDLKNKLEKSEKSRCYYQAKFDGAIETMRALKEDVHEN